LEEQAQMIEMQGRSIALLTPLLRRTNSSDILWFDNSSRSSGEVGEMCSCLPRSASTNQLLPVRVDYQCQGDTSRSFQLPCPDGVCSSRELPSCTESLEWDEAEVGFENCQELSFKGASLLCGVNGTKETTRRLHIGGGVVEEVVATSCNDCGDLSAALEWSAWAPCADETSGRVVEGMLCRRRGNTLMGFEEEEKGVYVTTIAVKTGTARYANSSCRAVMEICDAQGNCCRTSEKGQGLDNPGIPDHVHGETDIYTNRTILDNCAQEGSLAGDPVTVKLTTSDPHGDDAWYVEWIRITMSTGETFSCRMGGFLEDEVGSGYPSSRTVSCQKTDIICEAPWTRLPTGCYRFHASPLTQSEAKKFCEEEQEVAARLVEIDSEEENRAIVAEIKRRNFLLAFWLGITDRHSEGHWVLESTGKSVVFTNWSSGEPNNAGDEDCAHINDGNIYMKTWNDIRCNQQLGALCEM